MPGAACPSVTARNRTSGPNSGRADSVCCTSVTSPAAQEQTHRRGGGARKAGWKTQWTATAGCTSAVRPVAGWVMGWQGQFTAAACSRVSLCTAAAQLRMLRVCRTARLSSNRRTACKQRVASRMCHKNKHDSAAHMNQQRRTHHPAHLQSRPGPPPLSWHSLPHSCCCRHLQSSRRAGRRLAATAPAAAAVGTTSSSPSLHIPARRWHRCLRRAGERWALAGARASRTIPAARRHATVAAVPIEMEEGRKRWQAQPPRLCAVAQAVLQALTAALARPAQVIAQLSWRRCGPGGDG